MADSYQKVNNDYFANKPLAELAEECWTKIEDYRQFLTTSGRLVLWQNLYEAAYREFWMSGTNEKSGSNAQYSHTRINQFKSLIGRLKSIITGQKIKWQARAVNSDSASQKQAILANGILDYYLRTKNTGKAISMGVDWGLLLGEGFTAITWDAQAGELVDTFTDEDGTVIPIRPGDIRTTHFDPTCVVRDSQAQSWESVEWVITIERRNKYDEAAKYPELADRIAGMGTDATDEALWHFQPSWWQPSDDLIPVYHFYHKRTPACPAGRYAKFYASDLGVLAAALPYEEIPVYRYAPEEHLGTPFGYSVATNLLPMQESYDIVTDQILTNHEMYGVQNVAVLSGSNVQWQALPNGGNLIEVTPMPGIQDPFPRGLNLMKVDPDSYKFKQEMVNDMQVISGVNSVARGTPPEGVTAGTAMALIQSMAIQTNSQPQENYVRFVEHIGQGIISILRQYASVPRMAEIAGKDQRSFVREFSSKDLNNVHRVLVELGNPLTDTTAGRVNIAENLLAKNMIASPQEYITVLNTGNLEPLTHGAEAELLLIQKENEELADGNFMPVLPIDAHQLHIDEHKAVLADPDARTNQPLIDLVMAHINAHEAFLAPPPPVGPDGQPLAPPPGAPPGMPPPPPGPPGGPPVGPALNGPLGAPSPTPPLPKPAVSPLEPPMQAG